MLNLPHYPWLKYRDTVTRTPKRAKNSAILLLKDAVLANGDFRYTLNTSRSSGRFGGIMEFGF